ncbi:MAG: LptE family protein [Candidatus Aminicenantes bacterium]|nr:LptE family protein [Candidatus Aminicenantes bacterium]
MQEKIKLLKLGVVILFSLLVLFGGCRYQWQPPFPSSILKIAIPTFLNEKTFEYGLEETLTRLVEEEFILDGRLDIVEENEADLILEGRIDYYLKELLSGTAGAEEYRVRIGVVVSLISTGEKEVLEEAEEREIEEMTVYSLVRTIQTEDEAKNETCRKIGRELVRLIWEEWRG